MGDDVRKWCEENGVAVDADGLPARGFVPGPARDCIRCGVPAEGVGEAVVGRGDEVKQGGLCGDCYRLQFADQRAFFDGFKWGGPD